MISIQSKSPNTPYQSEQGIQRHGLSALDPLALDFSTSNSHAIIGAPDEDLKFKDGSFLSNAGSAYIYESEVDGDWETTQKIVASDAEANDLFGWSAASSGNIAIIGAPHEDHTASGGATANSSGAAYIFEKQPNGNWTEQQKIVASDPMSNAQFGFSVAISENYLIIGADQAKAINGSSPMPVTGAVYIFERAANGEWVEVQKLIIEDDREVAGFGYMVSIRGELAMVGLRGEAAKEKGGEELSNAEAVYIYERGSDGVWAERQRIMNPRETFLLMEQLF